MRSRLPETFGVFLLFIQLGFSQVPSVQLKIKESSGFLGLGGPRIVEFRLSNQDRKRPLNSVNVNAGPFVYFECVPVGDWQFDAGFVRDYLSNITVEQYNLILTIGYTGDIVFSGDTTSILLGYPKTLRIEQPFLVRFQSGDVKIEAEFKVPSEYWAGYETLTNLTSNAQRALSSNQYRLAISIYYDIISNNAFSIFLQQIDSKTALLNTFDAYLNDQMSALNALKDSVRLDLKEKIARVAGYRPIFMYVVDSLPKVPFEMVSLDSTANALRNRAKSAVLRVSSVSDSLQNILDEQNVRWILQGSVTGRKGLQYQEMIQALAYACSSLDFADSAASVVGATIPPQIQTRLVKDSLYESFQTFMRICSDRHQMRLTLFPVEFLPNLRKDMASFSLPVYSMLKAVSDYYSGNFASCRNEISALFRSCSSDDFLRRFDNLRVIVDWRQNHVPSEVFSLIREGASLEALKDLKGAENKYREAMTIAPDFAYSSCTLGEFYARSGDSLQAVSSFQKAYKLDTLYLTAYRNCYTLYRQQSNFQSMIDVLTLAIARGNDYWETNFSLGQAFVGVHDPVSAIARFARALELNPKSYDTYIALGKAYQASKDFPKARDYFNKAIEIDALRQEAVDALNKLNEQQLNVR